MRSRQALVLGPGLGREEASLELARKLWADCPGSLLMDADGLFALAENWGGVKTGAAQAVITPPSRRGGPPAGDIHRPGAGRPFGRGPQAGRPRRGGGGAQGRAHGDRRARRGGLDQPHRRAAVGQSGGSGDVLWLGSSAGSWAQGLGSLEAALVGCFAHGLAADLAAEEYGARGLAAEELTDWLPQAFAVLEGGDEQPPEQGSPC